MNRLEGRVALVTGAASGIGKNYPEARAAAFDAPLRRHGLIRLAVGLEAADDLIADLDAALTTAYGPAR